MLVFALTALQLGSSADAKPRKPRFRLAPLVSLAVALVWMGPYAWVALTSFEVIPRALGGAQRLARDLTFEAYRAFGDSAVAHYLLNSTVWPADRRLQIVLALPAGLALAKLRFVVAALRSASCSSPSRSCAGPLRAGFLMLGRIGLVNTMAALVLPFGASALGTFLVSQACFRSRRLWRRRVWTGQRASHHLRTAPAALRPAWRRFFC